MLYLNDPEWEDYVITDASKSGDWYDVRFREPHEADGCMGIGIPAPDCEAAGVVPKAGDTLRLCGSFGRPNRGAIVNGTLVFYRTEAEERARWEVQRAEYEAKRLREFEESGKAKLDAQYAALPPVFQARIDKFRHNNPDFRVEYEGYEMFCCEEAVKLARHLGTVEAIEHYAALATSEAYRTDATPEKTEWHRQWEEQKAIDRAAGISRDHSGNTHGTMVALAFWYLKHPENVERMHGALAPLVGSFAYGCVPPDEAL